MQKNFYLKIKLNFLQKKLKNYLDSFGLRLNKKLRINLKMIKKFHKKLYNKLFQNFRIILIRTLMKKKKNFLIQQKNTQKKNGRTKL